jgi:hypothetical protein
MRCRTAHLLPRPHCKMNCEEYLVGQIMQYLCVFFPRFWPPVFEHISEDSRYDRKWTSLVRMSPPRQGLLTVGLFTGRSRHEMNEFAKTKTWNVCN